MAGTRRRTVVALIAAAFAIGVAAGVAVVIAIDPDTTQADDDGYIRDVPRICLIAMHNAGQVIDNLRVAMDSSDPQSTLRGDYLNYEDDLATYEGNRQECIDAGYAPSPSLGEPRSTQ